MEVEETENQKENQAEGSGRRIWPKVFGFERRKESHGQRNMGIFLGAVKILLESPEEM